MWERCASSAKNSAFKIETSISVNSHISAKNLRDMGPHYRGGSLFSGRGFSSLGLACGSGLASGAGRASGAGLA
jgi:hypothetical protein